MKLSILIAALLIFGLSFNSFAQTQPTVTNTPLKVDTAKKPAAPAKPAKPQYNPDPAKVFHITLDLTGPEIYSITSALDGTLHKKNDISAAQADDFDTDNKSFAKAIKGQAGAQQDADYKKWQADTTALYHPDTAKLKGKPKTKSK